MRSVTFSRFASALTATAFQFLLLRYLCVFSSEYERNRKDARFGGNCQEVGITGSNENGQDRWKRHAIGANNHVTDVRELWAKGLDEVGGMGSLRSALYRGKMVAASCARYCSSLSFMAPYDSTIVYIIYTKPDDTWEIVVKSGRAGRTSRGRTPRGKTDS